MKGVYTLICCCLAFAAGTHAGLIVVDHAGSGDYATIGDAASASAAGDTVLVKDGAYDEMVIIRNAGTAGNPVVFRAENKHGARVERFAVITDHIWIEDFEVTGTAIDGIYCSGTYARITGNHVHDVGENAILTGEHAYVAYNLVERFRVGIRAESHTLVEYNRIFDQLEEYESKGYIGSTYFRGDSVIIRNNIMWNDTTVGDFTRTHQAARDFLFENNRCFNTMHASEPEPTGNNDQYGFTYRNNLFVNTYMVGVWIKPGIEKVACINNTFVNAGAYPFRLLNTCQAGNVAKNNIFYYYGNRKYTLRQTGPQKGVSGPGVYPPETGNNLYYGIGMSYNNDRLGELPSASEITADPLFVKLPVADSDEYNALTLADTAAWDLHLQPGSPALDAGAETGLAYDIDWYVRPDDGNPPDMGAYEHNSVPGEPVSAVRMPRDAHDVPQVRLYPVPVRDRLTVSGTGLRGSMRILDSAGNTVWQGMVDSNSHRIGLPHGLSAGRYYLSVADGAGVVPFCVIR